MTTAMTTATGTDRRRWRAPVLLLALGTFAMGTDSFVLAGILPQLSTGLDVSIGAAGQVITVFALTYAVLAPFLAAATHRVPRRTLVAVALVVFIIGNLGGAVAPDYGLLLLARVVTAVGAALYTPTANAAAIALAGPERRGTALSVVLGGLAVGTVLGVPVGTALGQALGWRASLVFIALVAVVALIALLVALPELPASQAASLRERLRVMILGRVVIIVAVSSMATASGFLFYSYITEVLGATAGLSPAQLAVGLLVWGAGAAIGAFAGGPLTDRFGARPTLAVAIALTGAAIVSLTAAHSVWSVLPLLLVGGVACWTVNTPANHLVAGAVPVLAPVAISFNASGTYLGQAVGAAVGGLLLAAGLAPTGLCLVAGAGSALTLLVLLISSWLDSASCRR